MAVTISKYQTWIEKTLTGTAFNWESDTIKVMLLSSAYTVDLTDQFVSEVSANQVTGSNYTAGGSTIGNISVTNTAGDNVVDGDDITWAQHASGFTDARYAVVYKDTGTAATSPLVFVIDLDSARTNQSGDLTLQWNAAGIFSAA